MTDIELIINYIYGERENIECLREYIEATNNSQTKELFERDITDTRARITQLENIIDNLKALEILKEKIYLIDEEEKELAINNSSSWKYPLTEKE